MGVPSHEKAPGGLKEPWLGIWRYALIDLKANGLWSASRRPWLDAYVEALRTAAEHGAMADADPVEVNRESGLTHVHAGFASRDKELRRAMVLADALGLTPKAQKALLTKSEERKPEEPAIVTRLDEIAQARARRSKR